MKKFLPIALVMSLCSMTAIAGPHLNASFTTMSSFGYNSGATVSGTQTVVIESALMALSSGNVTATAPSHYEVSLDNTTFSSTASIPYSNDMLAPTNVYIRLKSGLATGEFNNEQLEFAATGVSATVTLNGIITSPCIVTNGLITPTSAAFTWNATGAASYEVKVDQTASAPITAGIAAATSTFTATGLAAGTSYYFHVRGKGTNGNYTSWDNQAFSTNPTSIAATSKNDFNMLLMPNPNQGSFTVKGFLMNAQKITVAVMNTAGQVIYQGTAATTSGAFNQTIRLTENTPAGMYFVRLSANDQSSVSRFAITR